MLPNLVILGAARSGTTSLVRYLQQHPEVLMNKTKDTNYFAYNKDDPGRTMWGGKYYYKFPIRTLSEYRKLFQSDKNYKIIGECSAGYLVSKYAPGNIKENLASNVKFVVILRNPVDRAYSDFMRRKVKNNKLNYSEFYNNPLEKKWFLYGFYSEYLKIYFSMFGKENFHIIIFEEFVENTQENMDSLFKFLNVNNNINIEYKKYNSSGEARSKLLNIFAEKTKQLFYRLLPEKGIRYAKELYRINYKKSPELSKFTYDKVMKLYENDIKKLEVLLGRSLNIWYR